jgi:hypothetical protein
MFVNDSDISRLAHILSREHTAASCEHFSAADWQRLVDLALPHGVAPLFYSIVSQDEIATTIPSPLFLRLQQSYYQSTAHNLALYRELARILMFLRMVPASRTVPIVILKGAALAHTIYPYIGQRPMADLDLLVDVDHHELVVRILRSAGYTYAAPEMMAGLQRICYKDVTLTGGRFSTTSLDVHWRLISGTSDWRSPSVEWFWKQTVPWVMAAELLDRDQQRAWLPQPDQTFQFTATAHLLYNATHLMLGHGIGQMRLIWLYDLHLLLTHYAEQISWDELLEQAAIFRWSEPLLAALRATQHYFATPIPDTVLDVLAASSDTRAASMVHYMENPVQSRADALYIHLVNLNWHGRILIILAHILPTRDYLRWRYPLNLPAWLWPLYYPYRWYDLARDSAQTIATLIRRKLQRQQSTTTR